MRNYSLKRAEGGIFKLSPKLKANINRSKISYDIIAIYEDSRYFVHLGEYLEAYDEISPSSIRV